MDEGAGRAHLLGVRGIGPWTTDVYYLFALRHPDVWPRGDLALAQAMHEVKQLPARPGSHDQERVARRWAPYRSVAARILWHHYLSTR
jgi:DNA-3-methyladenine glycosylase II